MRNGRLLFTGALMIAGTIAGLFVVSDNHLTGAFMGAIAGFVVSVMVHAYPRNHDYPENRDFFSSD